MLSEGDIIPVITIPNSKKQILYIELIKIQENTTANSEYICTLHIFFDAGPLFFMVNYVCQPYFSESTHAPEWQCSERAVLERHAIQICDT